MSEVEDEVSSVTDPTRKRKRRPRLNCEECRRLKLKCDRKVPCDNCIKRNCSSICPDGARSGVRKSASGQHRLSTQSPEPATQGATHQLSATLPPGINQGQHGGSSSTTVSLRNIEDRNHSSNLTTGPTLTNGVSGPFSNTQFVQNGNMAPNVTFDMVPTTIGDGQVTQAGPPTSFNGYMMHNNQISPTNVPEEQSHGTLVISDTGRSKYLGPSAASEWLKDQEVEDLNDTPAVSRPSSPPADAAGIGRVRHMNFNILSSRNTPSMSDLMLCLPNPEEAEALIDCYYRYFGWSYEIIPRRDLQNTFEKVYDVLTGGQMDRRTKRTHAQQLALLFIVLAMGALHNLEIPADDPSGSDYAALARDALNAGDFMINNTIAGVQTLAIMAHYHLETDRGRNGDSAWPLWGLAMRIIQAMGLHRDGERWQLPPEVVQERRRVFWEVHSAEILQANCFGRPCSTPSEFIDTQFPQVNFGKRKDLVETHNSLKFHLSQISKDVLYLALCVNVNSPIADSRRLYDRLCAFERNIPFPLRCRTALLALPSLYSDPRQAERDSPEPNKRDLRRTFEQHHLALMVSEAIVNLYRPQFMKALNQNPHNPLGSEYGQPFLVVVERSNVIIRIVCELYSMFPSVTGRHWWCWYHAFNSAICLGTFILLSPHNDLTPVALSSMDQVIGIYTSIISARVSPRFVQNLQWLLRLRQRAINKIEHSSQPGGDEDTDLDAGLLGWRTRFIERANQGAQKATTISESSPADTVAQSSTRIDNVIHSLPQALQEHIIGTPSNPDLNTTPSAGNATDYFLHEFWDPLMMLQDDQGITGETPMTWDNILSQVEGST